MSKPDSEPFLEGFDPYAIPMQGELIDLLADWNYQDSTPEILLSGAYGSSKSIIMAHIAIVHCLTFPGAVVLLGRKALPDLKATIFNEIVEHLQTPSLEEGKHFTVRETTAQIKFFNGSKIISTSWSDRKYKKFRSLKISMFILEEGTENDSKDKEAFMNIKARLRRLPHVPQNILLVATNPDSPEHWLYDYFIEGSKNFESRKVLYSVTTENPFLDAVYVKQLMRDLSHKESLRYIYGQWVSINEEVIYSEYDENKNFINKKYKVNTAYPIYLSFDFNIALNKPMSMLLAQYIDDQLHVFEECVIHSARTDDVMEDLDERGLLDFNCTYIVTGDAAGKHRDTRSKRTDYDIIYEYLQNKEIPYIRKVPPSNPPIRKRHNLVNAYLKNSLGEHRIFLYKPCKMLSKGLKLTKLKEGSNYVEDDSFEWQHITTALGYCLTTIKKSENRKSHSRSL